MPGTEHKLKKMPIEVISDMVSSEAYHRRPITFASASQIWDTFTLLARKDFQTEVSIDTLDNLIEILFSCSEIFKSKSGCYVTKALIYSRHILQKKINKFSLFNLIFYLVNLNDTQRLKLFSAIWKTNPNNMSWKNFIASITQALISLDFELNYYFKIFIMEFQKLILFINTNPIALNKDEVRFGMEFNYLLHQVLHQQQSHSRIENEIVENFNDEGEKIPAPLKDILSSITDPIDKHFVYPIQHALVPKIWPRTKCQRGPNCGLYALELALTYGQFKKNPPPARKDGQKSIASIRERAKKLNLTLYGSIFSPQALHTLTNSFAMNSTILPTHENETEYINEICQALINNQVVIAACEVVDGYPVIGYGTGTHWALLFGFIFANNEYYFLATQYNNYFLWSAHDLYCSNKFMPAMTHYGFFSQEKKCSSQAKASSQPTMNSHPDTSLQDFRFGLLALPVENTDEKHGSVRRVLRS